MVHSCKVPYCNNKNSDTRLSFFAFPKDERFTKWCQILGLNPEVVKSHLNSHKICSVHFDSKQFVNERKVTLKKTAIPKSLRSESIYKNNAVSVIKAPQNKQLHLNYPKLPSVQSDGTNNSGQLEAPIPKPLLAQDQHNLETVAIASDQSHVQSQPANIPVESPTIADKQNFQKVTVISSNLIENPLTESGCSCDKNENTSKDDKTYLDKPTVLNVSYSSTDIEDLQNEPPVHSIIHEKDSINIKLKLQQDDCFCVVCNAILSPCSPNLLTVKDKAQICSILNEIFYLDCNFPMFMAGESIVCSICAVALKELRISYEDWKAYTIKFTTLRDSVVKQILKTFCRKLEEKCDESYMELCSKNLSRNEVERNFFEKFQDRVNLKSRIYTHVQATKEPLIPSLELKELKDATIPSINEPDLETDLSLSVEDDDLSDNYGEEQNVKLQIYGENAAPVMNMTEPKILITNEQEEMNPDVDLPIIQSSSLDLSSNNKIIMKNLPKNVGTKPVENVEKQEARNKKASRNNIVCKTRNEINTNINKRPRKRYTNYSRRKVKCKICHKVILITSFRFHMSNHAGDKPFSCKICGKKFSQPSNMITHRRTHDNPYQRHQHYCSWCEILFRTKTVFVRHVVEKHLKNQISDGHKIKFFCCDVDKCFKCYDTYDSFLEHVKQHSESPYKCGQCDKIFAMEANLKSHVVNVHETDSSAYCCLYCTEVFPNESTLTQHHKYHTVLIHSNMFPFLCGSCGKSFHNKINLRTHTTQGCKKRKKEYKRKLKPSNPEVAKPINNPQICQVCGAIFTKKICLQNHFDTHVYPHGFECYICNGKFTKMYKLELHIRKHKGETIQPKSLLPCKFCGTEVGGTFYKRFKHYAEAHYDEYMEEKPFLCKVCYRNWSTEEDLQKHQEKIHDKAKCKECGKQLKNVYHLNEHSVIHTGKKYHCSICDKRYSNAVNLKVHMWSHKVGSELPFQCNICTNVGFIRLSYLNAHTQKVHENSSDPTSTEPPSSKLKKRCRKKRKSLAEDTKSN